MNRAAGCLWAALSLVWSSASYSELVDHLISYDSGVPVVSSGDNFQGVRFSIPPVTAPARLLSVQFELSESTPQDITVHFWSDDLATRLIFPLSVMTNDFYTIVDVTDQDIMVDEFFYVILEPRGTALPMQDNRPNVGRSRGGFTSQPNNLTRRLLNNLILRAEVEIEDDVFAATFEGDAPALKRRSILLH